MTEPRNPISPRTNWRRLVIAGLGVVTWFGAVYGALSLSYVRSSWSGVLCGPWGCTAPLEAIVACHLAWLLVLLPGVAAIRQFGSSRHLKIAGRGLLGCALLGMLLLWINQFRSNSFSWFPHMWKLTGLAIISEVDFPVVPSLLTGIVTLVLRSREPLLAPHADEKGPDVPVSTRP